MIKVLIPGFYTTIQDMGRTGYANIGVPVSGAMDRYALKLANQLLQNNENDAAIELTFGQCKLQFETATYLCVSGADFSPQINGNRISLNMVQEIHKGDVLSFGRRNFGLRTYISVQGGIQSETVLQSRSFYRGITREHMVKKGMLLPIRKKVNISSHTNASVKIPESHFHSPEIKCYRGPEYEFLSRTQKKQLQDQLFTISGDIDRMGYRLTETIENTMVSMLTSGVLPGTVQLTPSGKLIVLMRDCQVTGGYPRILQLTGEGINRLTQKTTGDQFKFILKQ